MDELGNQQVNLTQVDENPTRLRVGVRQTVLYGVTFANPTRSGYTFAGWYIDDTKVTGINVGEDATFSSISEMYTKLASRTTGNKTVTAKWTANTYTVAYNGNGSTSGSTTSSTHTYDTSKNLASNGFRKDGYTFKNWNTKADGTGTSYSNGTSVKNLATSGTVTLYAQWTAKSATITYVAGSNGNVDKTSEIVTCTNNATGSTAIPDTGYHLDGWYGDNPSKKVAATAKLTPGNPNAQNGLGSTGYYGGTVTYDSASKTYSITTSTSSYNTSWGSGAAFTRSDEISYGKWYIVTMEVYSPIDATIKLDNNDYACTGSSWSGNDNDTNRNVYGFSTIKANTWTKMMFAYQNAHTGNTNKAAIYDCSGIGLVYDTSLGNQTFKIRNIQGMIADSFMGSATSYTAKFAANTYSVKYDGNGSTSGSMSNSSHTYNTAKALTANSYAKTGYAFAGWNTKSDGTGTSYTDKASVKNLTSTNGGTVTLYAQWSPYTLTINYHNDGAQQWTSYVQSDKVIDVTNKDIVETETVKYNATYAHATNGLLDVSRFTKTGYSTAGYWKVGSKTSTTKVSYADGTLANYGTNGAGVAKFLGVQTSFEKGDVTVDLYPEFTPNSYTIKYNGNGNTGGSTASSSHTYDTAKVLTANGFTKTGYSFTEWNTKADGTGTKYADKASVKNLASENGAVVNLYAQWKIDSYYLDLNSNLNSGKLVHAIADVYINDVKVATNVDDYCVQYPYGTKYKIVITPDQGYSVTPTEYSGTIGTARVNLIPTITANKYTISYNANGGSGTISSDTLAYDSAYTVKTNVFTKTGYTFKGWNTKADGTGEDWTSRIGNEFTWNYANNVTLYAQWRANVLTVVYYPNGATKADNSSNRDGSNIITIDPNSSNLTQSFNYDGTLPSYGLWDSQRYIRTGYSSSNKYRVGAKDGTIMLDAGPNVYSKPQNLAEAAGILSAFEKGDVTISIYADWTPVDYSITYNLDGGSLSGQKTKYNIETETFTLPMPTKIGYTFAGWVGSNGSTAQTSVSVTKGSTGNKTYTAKWTANKYTVTYNANNGTGTMAADSVTYGTAYMTKQNTFKRDGYIFNGWNEKADGTGTKWAITSGSSGTYESGKAWTWSYTRNITLYAQWIPESYNWTVPSTVTMKDGVTQSGTISVSGNNLSAGRTLKIKVASDATLKLKDKSNSSNTRSYYIKKDNDTLSAGSTILSLPTGTATGSQSISFGMSGSGQYAGTYQDILKFTATVE